MPRDVSIRRWFRCRTRFLIGLLMVFIPVNYIMRIESHILWSAHKVGVRQLSQSQHYELKRPTQIGKRQNDSEPEALIDRKSELPEALTDTFQNVTKLQLKRPTQIGKRQNDRKPEALIDRKPERPEALTDTFQNITKDGRHIVYNAYIDAPGSTFVRAVGFTMSLKPESNLRCLFWDTEMEPLVSLETDVTMQVLPLHKDRFRNAIYTCPIPTKNATAVTIKTKNASVAESPNKLKIKVSPEMNRTFTMCLTPIHFNRTIAYDIVEWVEYYRLMGVDHFVIYNFTSDPETDRILNHYEDKGILEVVQWKVPKHVIPEKHYYRILENKEITSAGQFAMLNDFLYRVLRSTKFVINVDLDEFIIPRNGSKTFSELLDKLPTACEYLIRNTLVPLDQKERDDLFPNIVLAKQYHLKTVLLNKRRNYVFGTDWKTKFIARTECSQLLWVHYVFKKRKTSLPETHVVDPGTALVYHYRHDYEKPIFRRGKIDIKDNSFKPFVEVLINSVKSVWDLVGLPSDNDLYNRFTK